MYSIIDISEDLTLIRLETPVSRRMGLATWISILDGLAIESGFLRARSCLIEAMKGRTITQIAVTHEHEDHIGNAGFLARRTGARLLAPKALLPVVAAPRSIRRYPYRWLMWGVPEPTKVKALPDVIETTRFRIEVIRAPGHTRDHVVFFEPEARILFTGDLFTGPWVRQARRVENVSDQIASLERVRDLRPRLMICYHKGPVKDPIPALEAKIDFMRALRDDTQRLRDKGHGPKAIARRLLGRETPLVHAFTMGDYTKVRLVKAALHPPGYYPVPIG